MLSPHPGAALEYWFFKVNAEPVALLVDWIARRKGKEHHLRVSIHSPQGRSVLFETLPSPPPPSRMNNDRTFITRRRTVGQLGDVAWDLAIECGSEWITPASVPAKLLRMTDTALASAPLATFSGWVRHGSVQVELQRTPGMLSHYWGRQLPREWWWISANQFDRPDVAVECSVFRSGLWGLPVQIPLAYLYLRIAGSRRLLISPPVLAQVKGSPERFDVHIRPLGREPITLKAYGHDYGDLGDSITNTLVGDLEIWKGNELIARAEGTAGLERRIPGVR